MNGSSQQFEGILDRYFERLLEDVPIFAVTIAGLREAEGKLGSSSPQFHAGREKERQKALAALENISPQELSAEQHLDRLALRSQILKESEDFARGRHALEPNAPEQLLNILLHELIRGDEEAARAAANIRSLLRQAPRFLEEAGPTVKRPEPVWLTVMEQAVAGAPTLLQAVAGFLAAQRPSKHDEALIGATNRSLQHYKATIRRRRSAPAGSFAIGAAALQRRIRDELGLDYTLGQVEALAEGEVQRVQHLLDEACKKLGRRKPAHELIAELRSQWRPNQPLLDLYRSETRRIAEGFRSARAVSFPKGDELVIKPVPEFLRNLIATAAYNPPGAFERRQRGVFFVNDLSLTQGTPEAKLAEQQQHFGIPLTCAHEAYPGHHLQFVTANRHPRKWRRLFAHAVFYEGWTLWCEQMMVDLKIDRSPWLQVQQLHDALWRCHRILVDLRLQNGRYTHAQAARHLQKHLAFTRARAEAEANWYTGQPAVPMSYWLGRLENRRLQSRLVEGRGWSLQQFNDWLLSFGTIPQAWIEKYGLD